MDKQKMYSIMKVALVVIVVILIFIGIQDAKVSIEDEGLKISGMYGKVFLWKDIQNVELLPNMPKIGTRTNGIAFGDTLKGQFKLDEYGSSTLYVRKSHEAFLKFNYGDKTILLSIPNQQNAKELFDHILNMTSK